MIEIFRFISIVYAAINPNETTKKSAFTTVVFTQNRETEEDQILSWSFKFHEEKSQKIKDFNRIKPLNTEEYSEIWNDLTKKNLSERTLLSLLSKTTEKEDGMFCCCNTYMYKQNLFSIDFIKEIFLKNPHLKLLTHLIFYIGLKNIKFQPQDIIFLIYYAWKDECFDAR